MHPEIPTSLMLEANHKTIKKIFGGITSRRVIVITTYFCCDWSRELVFLAWLWSNVRGNTFSLVPR